MAQSTFPSSSSQQLRTNNLSPPKSTCFEESFSYNFDMEHRMGEEHEVDVTVMCMLCKFGHHKPLDSDDRFAKLAINLESQSCLRFYQESAMTTEHLVRARDNYSWLMGSFPEFNVYPLLELDGQITAMREIQASILRNLYNLERVSEMIKSTNRYQKNKSRFQQPKKTYAQTVSK